MNQYFGDLSIAIIFFGFNRPDKISKSISSYLATTNAKTTDIYVFIDGPRNLDEKSLTDETNNIVHKLLIDCDATIFYHNSNLGLKKSIFTGVSRVLLKHQAVIVIEDDLVLDSNFFNFMSTGLKLYCNNKNVYQISGFNYLKEEDSSAFFLPLTTSWGWATWNDRWKEFNIETDFSHLLKNGKSKRNFNFLGSFPFSTMLQKEIDGKISSWAIRWYSYVFTNEGVVLYPSKSLVINDGFDTSGTHSSYTGNELFNYRGDSKVDKIVFPIEIQVDALKVSRLAAYFRKSKWKKVLGYIKSKLKWTNL